jgi:hypothetical protein
LLVAVAAVQAIEPQIMAAAVAAEEGLLLK